MSFVHLHVHTEYSLLDGMSTVKELFKRAEELRMPGLAITDHGTMMGVMDFMQTAKKYPSVKPIAGCEIYLTRHYNHTIHDLEHKKYFHLILLAKNIIGYHNLCRIASIAGTEGKYYRPRIDHDTLKKFREGLICLSACIGGEVPQAILEDDIQEAERAIEWYKSVFGNDYYLEVCWHRNNREGKPQDVSEMQQTACNRIFELAEKHNVKVVATNDSHFTLKSQARAHDTMLAISCDKLISDTDRLHYTGEEYLKDEKEMLSLFPEHPEAITNTIDILNKIELYELEGKFSVPCPKQFSQVEDRFEALSSLASKGLNKLYPDGNSEAKRRLEWELEQVKAGGFENYFLLLYDVMRYADSQNIWYGPGRGSAVGSILCYCLGINKIDPVKYGLQSERFWKLGKALIRPDVDIDFELEGRSKIIKYLKDQYGDASVSEVITLGIFSSKYAMKAALKAYGVPATEISRIMSIMENGPISLKDENGVHYLSPTLANYKKYCQRFFREISKNDIYEKAFQDALEFEGRKNASGIHACAVLVSDKPLSETVPVTYQVRYGQIYPELVSQYDAHLVENTGLAKFDFLELKQLSILKDTATEANIDITNIPLNDRCALNQFTKDDTKGIFLFESDIAKDACHQVKLNNLSEVFAINAMCRPGPIEFIQDYAINKLYAGARISRGETVDSILDETYGILIYQEQLNDILNKVGGFSLLEAEGIRRLMARRKQDEIREAKCKFLVGGMNRGMTRKVLVDLWDYMNFMACLCFMKSHSVSYGMVSYLCAYMKTYALKARGQKLENIYMSNCRKYSLEEE